jgi:hypothetical protein
MLIQESHVDIATQAGGDMRLFLFHPTIPNYPKAKFPGVVCFSEIYQGMELFWFSLGILLRLHASSVFFPVQIQK